MSTTTSAESDERAERRRRLLSIGGVVLAVVVLAAASFWLTRPDAPGEIAAPPAGEGEFGVVVGPADAPRTVVVYEDFLCPFCGELEAATRADLAQLAEDGAVLVEYRPFDLLGSERTEYYSVAAASAFKVVLDAAGPDVAKAFHDALYEDQPSEAGPFPDADWLVEKAVDAGAVEADVRAGIEDRAQEDWVERATQAASDAGVTSTPTILLDGEVFTDGRTIEDRAARLIEELQ